MQLILENYGAAVEHLHACESVSGVAGWASAAEAAEFWAKMKDDEAALTAAKDFKVHCYREYWALAIKEKGPIARCAGRGKGRYPGPSSWLMSQGLTASEAGTASRLGRMSEADIKNRMGKGHAPATIARHIARDLDAQYLSDILSHILTTSHSRTSASVAASVMRSRLTQLPNNTLKRLRECIDWLVAVESELLRLTSLKSDD